MKVQVIQDENGKNTGVFIPIEDWNLIKSTYPDITNVSKEIPQWQKDLIDERLAIIATDSNRIKPIENLFQKLNNEA